MSCYHCGDDPCCGHVIMKSNPKTSRSGLIYKQREDGSVEVTVPDQQTITLPSRDGSPGSKPSGGWLKDYGDEVVLKHLVPGMWVEVADEVWSGDEMYIGVDGKLYKKKEGG
jgi:hypothetical protein